MSDVKKSLEENMDYIREKLPKDLKDSAESCLVNCEVIHDDEDFLKQQIIHELPDEISANIDIDSVLPTAQPAPSFDEQKAEVLKTLPEEFKADFEKNAKNELLGK